MEFNAGIALLLLCAVALAQADRPQRTRSGENCICHSDEAKSACSKYGSHGYLIMHENCNQFYKCSNGQAIPYFCPPNLHYNPFTYICDWPSNVECGHRPIVEESDCDDESESDQSSSDQSDSSESDSSASDSSEDHDNNGGSCNSNSGDALGICGAEGSNDILVAHENCNQFYKCDHGVPVALNCPSGLLYNPCTEQCDWAHKVECGDRPVVDIDNGGSNGGEEDCSEESNNGNGDNGSGNGNGDNGTGGGTCNCNPGEAPGICAVDGSDGTLVAHEHCNQFYKCAHGKPVTLSCPAGLMYNPYIECCDWPYNVECGDKPIIDIGGGNNGDNGSGNGNGDNGSGNGNGDSGSGNGNGDNETGEGTCNCNPDEAPGICAEDGSDGTLVAHKHCNQFYKCAHGAPVTMSCPAGLVYNPYIECCDWPYNVECGDKPIVEIGGGNNGDNGNGDGNGDNGNGNGNGDSGSGNGNGDNGNGDNGTGEGTCNCNPGEAPGICAVDGSNGILIAHKNCNQFYKCDHGVPVAFNCNKGLLYNPYTEQCDWPENVDCGDKPIGGGNNGDNGSGNGNGDNGNGDNGSGNGNGDSGSGNGNGDNGTGGGTCNCNPGEAPGICAADGSYGILIAHENCNQFYKCDHGKPVAFNCHKGLLYNPYTEQCDWPENVDCGDKPIGGGNNGDNDSGNGDNGNGDNGGGNGNGDSGSGNGNGDNGTGGGTCNCNPGEAPGICAADGSNGILIAHENCNQFYKCDHGKPVEFKCHNGLLYNPYTEQCDWPKNVECGDKPIGGGNNGDNGNGDNNNGDNDSGNGNGDNGSGNGNGDNETGGATCNCNPGEAPGICAADGSYGVLIAHENCNQFYKCDHGKPVEFKCHNGLLYNPYTEQCDWPKNVECGGKPIGGGNNGDNGSGDSGSGHGNGNIGSGNGNGDNETGDGTCKCNPGEAPAICATGGSEGVLIAHEKCNKFYKCSYGNPVAIACPSNLLYNPFIEVCDWPWNVECGERVTPEAGGDNGGDNEDSENGNTGGNCDPSQAPAICTADGSNGVLVANENCDQYYVCSNGLPVALNCPTNLLYNPIIEQCDWPRNVDCGERVVPVPEAESDTGICFCNPRQAPSICASSHSDGKMIAHEACNQYYVCFNGKPIARSCPHSLFYDPQTKQCNWPAAVSCDGRDVTTHFSLNKHMQARRGIF